MSEEYLKADKPHVPWPKDPQTGLSEEFLRKARELVMKQMDENAKKPISTTPNTFEKY
jgi:hypothetical protein